MGSMRLPYQQTNYYKTPVRRADTLHDVPYLCDCARMQRSRTVTPSVRFTIAPSRKLIRQIRASRGWGVAGIHRTFLHIDAALHNDTFKKMKRIHKLYSSRRMKVSRIIFR
jgi:hypothetical protein